MYKKHVEEIIQNADKYHLAYYDVGPFGGPSLYFHLRSLSTRGSFASDIHLEYVYATLTAWGMHRMGRGGPKMVPFDTFRNSILVLKDKIAVCQRLQPQSMNEGDWVLLRDIFSGMRILTNKVHLVSHSKVMHHMMPNIIPPIDREYTLWYLRGNTNIPTDISREWQMLKEMVSGFFLPIARDEGFAKKASSWMEQNLEFPWDTSLLKIIDNLLIGAVNELAQPTN